MNPATKDAIQEFLLKEVKPKLLAYDQLKEVVIWVDAYNENTKIVRLGLALGKSTGCSPFCGCAAHQLTEQVEKLLIQKFPDIEKAYGVAKIPPKEILEQWQKS